MLLGHGALVADVVLELGPGVLQHGAHLYRGAAPSQRLVGGRHGAARVDGDEQVSAGVPEPALASGLLTHVAVVEHRELLTQHIGDSRHVAVDVGDDPQTDLVGDAGKRVRVERLSAHQPLRLAREGGHRLGAPADTEVVDARVVEQVGDQLNEQLGGCLELGQPSGIGVDGETDRVLGGAGRRHAPILPAPGQR